MSEIVKISIDHDKETKTNLDFIRHESEVTLNSVHLMRLKKGRWEIDGFWRRLDQRSSNLERPEIPEEMMAQVVHIFREKIQYVENIIE